jgi:hypothetical protein
VTDISSNHIHGHSISGDTITATDISSNHIYGTNQLVGDITGYGADFLGAMADTTTKLIVGCGDANAELQKWVGPGGRTMTLYTPVYDANDNEPFRFKTNNAYKFQVDSISAIDIDSNGAANVGQVNITGNTSIANKVALEVYAGTSTYVYTAGSTGDAHPATRRIYAMENTNDWAYDGNDWGDTGLCARFHNRVAVRAMFFWSDRRIKKNIVDIQDDEALRKLRLFQPKKYEYIDTHIDVSGSVYGFIAQEVKEVCSEAIAITTQEVPYDNIVNVNNENTILTFKQSHDLVINQKLKIINVSGDSFDINVVDIIDNLRIKIDKVFKITDMTPNHEMYIISKEVNDFHNLKKDVIFTITTAAVQEIDRKQQANELRIKSLEQRILELENRI